MHEEVDLSNRTPGVRGLQINPVTNIARNDLPSAAKLEANLNDFFQGRRMKNTFLGLLTFFLSVLPALAGVSVSAPKSGQSVTSPAKFTASSTTSCNKGVASMGIYIDNKLAYTVSGDTLNWALPMPSGTHNTVVEEWDKCGGATYTAVDGLKVTASGSQAAPSGIPSNAISSGNLTGSDRWAWNHDSGTPGSSTGYSSYAVSKPSLDGAAREFSVSYSKKGGEIYHMSFANDENSTHFVYDTYIYSVWPSETANIEMDMNQVMSNGKTVIFGVQCSSYSGTWEFVTVSGNSPHWHSSNLGCNPKNWSADAWHHIQIASHRDSYGDVTYDWVSLDGKTGYFVGAHGAAAMSLGWAHGDLLINFQLDGSSSSSAQMKEYIDKLTIYRW